MGTRSTGRALFAALRQFSEWWVDERPGVLCCQFADQDVIDTDAEHFDCQTCPVPAAFAWLDADNVEAWRIYGQCCTRFAVDLGLVPVHFQALIAGMGPDAVDDLMQRLAVIHDVLSPRQVQES